MHNATHRPLGLGKVNKNVMSLDVTNNLSYSINMNADVPEVTLKPIVYNDYTFNFTDLFYLKPWDPCFMAYD